jgi:lysyl-tRNA synthetase class 2
MFCAAVAAWSLVGALLIIAPAERELRGVHVLHPLRGAASIGLSHAHAGAPWTVLIDLLVAWALVSSALAVRALRSPRWDGAARSHEALERARAIVDQHGDDSIAPFILRADKSFEFGGGAVVGYRVIGDTAVVSGDPVGPDDGAAEVMRRLLQRARSARVKVVIYGAGERRIALYRELGLRVVCAGEEAIVNPAAFTLAGRTVRKLRQSVNRIERRGWRIGVYEGRQIDQRLEAEIDTLEACWRSARRRVLGFAMSLGEYEFGVRPDDLYLLARAPDGRLAAVMRFLAHREKLSLDVMRRVGETPNGLNEALICHALEFARARHVAEVSLNYAGLGHLVRLGPSGGPVARLATRLALAALRTRFQMDRLLLFNQKFAPTWRPRYLVYESAAALPRSVVRVLQAEGYLPEPRGTRPHSERELWLGGSMSARFGRRLRG